MADAHQTGDRAHDGSDVGNVQATARESQKLLSLLAVQLLKSFQDQKMPAEIKLLLAPLLFMIPTYSLLLVIFFGDFTYCMVQGREFQRLYYLLFLGITGPITAVMFLTYTLFASRFENTRNLELQLESVTRARRPRKGRLPQPGMQSP